MCYLTPTNFTTPMYYYYYYYYPNPNNMYININNKQLSK